MASDLEVVKILIVDDLPEKVLVLETILAEVEGVSIHAVRSGEEALQQVLEHEFAVILLDVNMPGMDGFETAEFIRRRKRSAHTPIIFVTAFADEMLAARGYSLGAVDYILSPVVPEVLRSKVSVFVDLFRMTQQVRRQAEQQVQLAREQAARAAAEKASQRASFLSEASRVLAASLDAETTWQALGRLVVPTLADFCGITRIAGNERPGQTELLWSDAQGDLCTMLYSRHADAGSGIEDCISRMLAARDVVAVPFQESEWPFAAQCSHPDGSPRINDETTVVCLPLCVGSRFVGALTLGISSERETTLDVPLAEDLAARAAIALENARLYEDLREAGIRKDEFLAMLAHELRNPLAPIRNAAEVLRLIGLPDPTSEQVVEMIDRQVVHMARLIDDLLDFSRLSRGKILLRKDSVDLCGVVHSVVDDLRDVLEQNELTLELRLPKSPVYMQGDATRLAQVVTNIMHNANKFTDPGGRISVELTADGPGTALLSIRDTGIGMEPNMLERAFESFSQADQTLDRSRGGLGLGLALVKQLVQLHGGTVRAFSEGLGQGTEIRIVLPVCDEAMEQVPRQSPALDIVEAKPVRILVIEDNPDTAESLRMILSLSGHEVTVAFDGAQGLELAREWFPDVVLCDIGLPGGLDGYAVARAMRQEFGLASVYLVATTGYGQQQDRLRAQAAGFDAHLTKPVELTELQRLLVGVSNRLVPN